MTPVEHRGQARFLQTIGGERMPVSYVGGAYFSYWKPSLREWFGLLLGRAVRVCIVAGHPTIALRVRKVP